MKADKNVFLVLQGANEAGKCEEAEEESVKEKGGMILYTLNTESEWVLI